MVYLIIFVPEFFETTWKIADPVLHNRPYKVISYSSVTNKMHGRKVITPDTILHIYEPRHGLPYKSVCAPCTEDSDQLTNPCNLIKVFAGNFVGS